MKRYLCKYKDNGKKDGKKRLKKEKRGKTRHYIQFPLSPPLKKDYRFSIVLFLRFYLRFCKFYTPTFKRFCLIFSHVLATKRKKILIFFEIPRYFS
nr:MAG TPA: hypothetical protein [Caudoviricetes sp.]